MNNKNVKKLTFGEALEKMRHFCAYQDRCFFEVEQKLKLHGVWGETAQNITYKLLEEGFLNEERFVKNYTKSKFKYNNWGRVKIKMHLKQKQISEKLIQIGLAEINEEEYFDKLTSLINKKEPLIKAKNAYEKKIKLIKYAQGKGFEMNIIHTIINTDYE